MNHNYFTISQAAQYLNVSEMTLRRWDKKGKLIAKRSPSNHRQYTKTMLDNALNGKFYEDNNRSQYGIGYCHVPSGDKYMGLAIQRRAVKDYLHREGVSYEVIMDEEDADAVDREKFQDLIMQICNKECSILMIVGALCVAETKPEYRLFKLICKTNRVKLINLSDQPGFNLNEYTYINKK